jgi:primosomal protein N' (replication factor Y)
MPAYCEIALPVPLDRVFTYAVCAGQQPRRGARVIVPFRNEKLIGVVTALHAKLPADFEARYIEAVLDEEPLLSDRLLALAEWMAQYYLAPLGEVLRGMLPLMAEVKRTVYYRITDLGRDMLAAAVEGEAQGQFSAGAKQAAEKVNPEGGGGFNPRIKSRETTWALAPEGCFPPKLPESGLFPQQQRTGPRTNAKRRNRISAEEQDLERRVLASLAAGEAVKVSSLRTATAATLPVLAGMTRKKWIARETSAVERDARRMERFDREAAGDSGRAGGLRQRAAAGRAAPQGAAQLHAANAGPPRPGAHRGAAGCLPPGWFAAGEWALPAQRDADRGPGQHRHRAWGLPCVFAAWRHRLRQDGGLSGGDAACS